jgi:hypothetical protein
VFIYVIGLGNGDGVLCEIRAEDKEAVDHKKGTTQTESVFCEL